MIDPNILSMVPNGGVAVALIIVIVLNNHQIRLITSAFQTQIQGLTDQILRVSVETSKAIGDLAAAVRQLEIKSVDSHQE